MHIVPPTVLRFCAYTCELRPLSVLFHYCVRKKKVKAFVFSNLVYNCLFKGEPSNLPNPSEMYAFSPFISPINMLGVQVLGWMIHCVEFSNDVPYFIVYHI